MKTLLNIKTLLIICAGFIYLNLFSQQMCENTFVTEIFYTNPCTDEDFINDDNIQNTMVEITVDYKIFYRDEIVNDDCNSTLDIEKPVLIIEGFDFMEYINNDNIYDFYLNGFGDGTQLREQGYDIITYNIRPSQCLSSIEVNAMILANFIDFINDNKNSDEELIIIGVSMGGLVTRYTLSYMEENNRQHQTKLFISFDAPQKGASVPVSMQGLTYEIALLGALSLVVGIDDLALAIYLFSVLRSPAALAMNMYDAAKIENGHISPSNCFTNFFYNLKNLNSCNGYPQNCKKVAISNGSINMETQEGLDPLGDVSGNPVFKFHAAHIYRVLYTIAGSDNPSVTSTCAVKGDEEDECTSDHYLYLENYMDPIEHVPGGYYPWYGLLYDILDPIQEIGIDYIHTTKATFVPTISALDLFTDNAMYPISSYSKAQILAMSNFDDIWWDDVHLNMQHTSLNSELGEWIYETITDFSSSDNFCKENDIDIDNINFINGKRGFYKAVDDISAKNISVNTGGKLTLKAGNTILIEKSFYIDIGSTLNIDIEQYDLANCKSEP